jgi:hypothetical protein
MSYRQAEPLADAGDVPEMSDPQFLVAYATSELMIDDDINQFSKYSNDALLILANMRQVNERLAQGQEMSAFDDFSEGLG